jgi:MSHA pilin protein MshD
MFTSKAPRGISLIELVLYIVIVSIALAGLLSVLNINIKASVDPMVRKQALAIAESLLEEVQLQDFSNPVGGFSGAATQANRASFDDVMDYNGFATTGIYPADGSSTVVPGLANYNVSITVVNAGADFSLSNSEAVKITVTVTMPDRNTLDALGYRFNY